MTTAGVGAAGTSRVLEVLEEVVLVARAAGREVLLEHEALALVGALGLLSATVLGRLIPFFAGDFLDRAEVPAHIVARESAVPVRKPRAPKAPKEATDGTASKAAGTSAVAGWAKRMTPGGQPAATEPAPRGYESFGAGAGAAGTAAASGAAAGSAASTPAAAQQAPAQPAAPAPVVSSPETQAAAVVPAASAAEAPATPVAPSAAGQTQAAAVVPPAAKSAAGGQVPDAQARAAAAAEDTRAAEVPVAASHSAPTTVNPQVRQQEPIGATVDPASRPEEHEAQPAYEAFWFAVAQPRTAMDEHSGAAAFVIEPGGWVLALEDRGHEFLVQHTDGRVGVLRDLSNIERG